MRRRTSWGWRATSKPATDADPASIGSRVVSMRRVVVFPAPLGPRNPKISPGATEMVTPRTASTAPRGLAKVLRRLVVWMIGSIGPLLSGRMRSGQEGFWSSGAGHSPSGGCEAQSGAPARAWIERHQSRPSNVPLAI